MKTPEKVNLPLLVKAGRVAIVPSPPEVRAPANKRGAIARGRREIRFIVFAAALLASGCQSMPSGLLVQPILDRLVPAEFNGDGEFAERGQYLTIEVKVKGLRKGNGGVWTWSALEYRRVLTIPVAPAIPPYRHEGVFNLRPPSTGG